MEYTLLFDANNKLTTITILLRLTAVGILSLGLIYYSFFKPKVIYPGKRANGPTRIGPLGNFHLVR